MNKGKLVDKLLAEASKLLAAANAPTPEQREEDSLLFLADFCREMLGKEDPRGNVEHLRTLTEHERCEAYRQAMEVAADRWIESPEGQQFKSLPYGEQVNRCIEVTRRGDDILAIHGMRKSMRETKWREWYARQKGV